MANRMHRFDNNDPKPLNGMQHPEGVVEPDGIEPTTSAVRLLRSPN